MKNKSLGTSYEKISSNLYCYQTSVPTLFSKEKSHQFSVKLAKIILKLDISIQ